MLPTTPQDLERFNVSASEYLTAHASAENLLVSVIVSDATRLGEHHIRDPDRILLLQRAANDSAPGVWELPGGSYDEKLDKTVLQTLRRELWEETGLQISAITHLAAEIDFQDKHYPGIVWRSLTFAVQVEETRCENHERLLSHCDCTHSMDRLGPSMHIRTNPSEHQSWAWATLAQIAANKSSKCPMELFETQKEIILQAFRGETSKMNFSTQHNVSLS